MPHIVLTEDQVRVIAKATESVEVRDAQGRIHAFLQPLDPEEAAIIAEAKRRSRQSGPRIPSAQVHAHMQKLEEIAQREPLDEAKVRDLLRRMRAGEDV